MDYKYVSIDRIFAKFGRDISNTFNERDLIEWSGEALEFIGAIKLYEEAIAFIEVKNFQCALPSLLHSIVQIGMDTQWTGPTDECSPKSIVEACSNSSFVQITEGNSCNIQSMKSATPDYIILDCNGMPLNDYDLAYYRPYFDLQAEGFGVIGESGFFKQRYVPIRLATTTLFDSLVCQTPVDSFNNRCPSKYEYSVIQGTILRFNFISGFVAVSYRRQVLDKETGYPMIPDNVSYITAITKYITLKTFEKEFYAGREGSQAKMNKAESDWQWYCGQASNVDKMPHGIDEYQNLLDQRSRMIPDTSSYYSFFGNMSNPEYRSWNDPDHRNYRNSGIRLR